MSMKLIQHSNTIERRLKSTSSLFSKSEFTSNSINHQTDQCHTCRRPEVGLIFNENEEEDCYDLEYG